MEEYRTLLDQGITMETDEATITLDFTKIFQRNKMDEETTQMSLFMDLGLSPFKDLIEHPLCHTFLHKQFNKVIWYFVLFMLLPHLIFCTVYSLYCGVFFGYLCVPGDTEEYQRWDLYREIPCRQLDYIEVNIVTGFYFYNIYNINNK